MHGMSSIARPVCHLADLRLLTDAILRERTLWTEFAVPDFVTLLHHANEVELTREARDIFRPDRRNRRGTNQFAIFGCRHHAEALSTTPQFPHYR